MRTGVVVTKSLTLNINAMLSMDTDNATLPLPSGHENQPYGPAILAASGGTPPYTWSVTPPLPASLTLNNITGEMTGRRMSVALEQRLTRLLCRTQRVSR